MPSEPLGALPYDAAPLQHFVSKQIAEPDGADAAELGRLLASAMRQRNQIFLASLMLPSEASAATALLPNAKELTAEDLDELRHFVLSARSDASAAAMAKTLATELLRPRASIPANSAAQEDTAEVLTLLNEARRPRVKGLLRLTAARLVVDEARSGPDEPLFPSSPSEPPATAAAVGAEAAVASAPRAPPPASATAATDAATDVAVARTPSSLPPLESSVLLLALPGALAAAHRVGTLLSHSAGVSPLPAPWALDGGAAYPWLVRTRYYSATVWLVVHALAGSVEETAVADAASLASEAGAVVVLFDQSQPDSWAKFVAAWEGSALSDASANLDISIALGVRGIGGEGSCGSGGGGVPAPTLSTERVEWCLDAGVELIEADLGAGSEEPKLAWTAALCADSGVTRRLEEDDPEGLVRLVEALTMRVWPPIEGEPREREAALAVHERAVAGYAASLGLSPPAAAKTPSEEEKEAEDAKARGDARAQAAAAAAVAAVAAAEGGGNVAKDEPEPLGSSFDDVYFGKAKGWSAPMDAPQTRKLLNQLAGDEPSKGFGGEAIPGDDAQTKAEREQDAVEKLIEKMAYLREKGDKLPPDERRRRAAMAAMEMAKLMGDDEEMEDDADDVGE